MKASQLLFEDAVQPVELDLAVSLAAIYRANHVVRIRAGQLLVELVPRGHHQWSFAFAGYVQRGAREGNQVRSRLAGGGSRIRTLGPPKVECFPNSLLPPLLAAKPCRDRWTQPER